jgi:peptide/nickel transport system permease protein
MLALIRSVIRRPLGAISAGFLLLLIVACVAAPWIAHASPTAENLTAALQKPSLSHLLGTDELGRDILSRLLYGGRATLLGVAEAEVVFLALGILLGILGGYVAGWVDSVISVVVDLLLSIPSILIALAILSIFPANMLAAMVTFGVLASAGLARVVRSVTLGVREELYIDAAKAAGIGKARIIRTHVLPRIAGPIIVQATLFAAMALVLQCGVAYLGLGIIPPAPSWGGMIAEAQNLILQAPWFLAPVGIIMALTILALGLLGDALRDSTTERWSAPSAMRPAGGARLRRRAARDSAAPVAGARGSLLSVRNLTVVLRSKDTEVELIRDVNFDLEPGEVLGIIGESGGGKSITALSVIGLLPSAARISSGSIFLEGQELVGKTNREFESYRGSQVGMIFQEPMARLDPTWRVGKLLVEVVRRHQKMSRAAARQRALELLEVVALPDPQGAANRYPHELSGGMAQRVCLALALAGNPKLLIADEPTTALDVTVQAEILSLLRRIQSESNMGLVIVTHDCGVVADICDRAIVMYAGEVVENASVEELFHHPRHPYSRGLLDANPESSADALSLPTIPGSVPSPGSWPVGCHFQDRCAHSVDECKQGPILLAETSARHASRCVRANELAEALEPQWVSNVPT